MVKKILRKRKGQWVTLSLTLGALVAISSNQALVVAQEAQSSYTVQAGDTLYSIALRHNISLEELKSLNNLSSNIIIPGTSLWVQAVNNELPTEEPALPETNEEETNTDTPIETPVNPPVENEETQTLPTESNIYVVQAGDSINLISAKFGITPSQLRSWNGLSSNLIHPGDRLLVSQTVVTPTPPVNEEEKEETPQPSTTTSYTVVAGDYLHKIATQYGITVENLKDWNNLSSNYIYVGDVLRVSAPTTTNPNPVNPPEENEDEQEDLVSNEYYTVKAGDFVNRIAAMHGITADQLRTWNNLSSNLIHPGDRLIVAKTTSPSPSLPEEEVEETPEDTNKPEEGSPTETYTVVAGDYLHKIAVRYGITVQNIKDWNNLSSNYIYVGDILVVTDPSTQAPVEDKEEDTDTGTEVDEDKEPQPTATEYYTVLAGDSINKIAAQHGISPSQLREWNKLTSNLIHPGDRLIVQMGTEEDFEESPEETPETPEEPEAPEEDKEENSSKTHTVVAGDYLYKIATKYGVSVQNLKDWNKMTNNYVYVGDVLYVSQPTTGNEDTTNPTTPNNPDPAPNPSDSTSDMPDLTNVEAISVDYDVKLNGKTEVFRTAKSLIGNSYDVVDYFGQRFRAVNEYHANGVTYLELVNDNGTVFGYLPATATVQVPRGVNTVYLDAGHGGWETGSTANGSLEKDLNLNISLQLADRLREQGYVVYETRTTDEYVKLHNRQDDPNSLMPDAYISIHHNAMPIPNTAQGIVTLYHDPSIDEPGYLTMDHHHGTDIIPEGKRLSAAIQNELIKATGAVNQGIRPQNLHVTRTTDVPATLVELGFQDHWADYQKIINPSYQQKLINGLLNGINAYFGKTK